MMWDHVIRRVLAAIADDSELSAIYGARVRAAAVGDFDPSVATLEYTLIGDTEGELWSPVILQLDQWAPKFDVVTRSERRLRGLFHRDLPVDFDGLAMWCQYQDGSTLAAPNRDGVSGRGIRFRFTPIRERYAGLAPGA